MRVASRRSRTSAVAIDRIPADPVFCCQIWRFHDDTRYSRNAAVYGLDLGLINDADRIGAIQAGLINLARESAGGFQIGGFNWAPELTGAQIGGLNYARNAWGLGFMPVFNSAF